MEATSWDGFVEARERFRGGIADMRAGLPRLGKALQALVDDRSPSYLVETPIVFNAALDDVTRDSDIRLIVVGDNPGRREQAAGRYLVGPSGKLAEGFFRAHPSLGVDFRGNALILNKTPIHTPRTSDLRRLRGSVFADALDESQRFMARLLRDFQSALGVPAWITGYSEMRRGGVFEAYTDEIRGLYAADGPGSPPLLLFRHFSMNQFSADFRRNAAEGEPAELALTRIGDGYRRRVLSLP